jgi:hypothetical protein
MILRCMVVSCAPELADGQAHVHKTLWRIRHMHIYQRKAGRVNITAVQVDPFLSLDCHSQPAQRQVVF